MGKSAYQIKMDYNRAIQQANKLEKIGGEVERLAHKSMEDCLRKIASDWKGDASNQYNQKGHRVTNDLTKLGKELKKTAETVRKIAKKTYETEKHAIEIAKKRAYHE